MNKNEFIREWCKRSGLNLKDGKEIFNIFIEMIEEAVESREELHLKGFGHLYFSKHVLPASKRFDITQNQLVDTSEQEVETVGFRLSRNLKDLMIPDPSKRRLVQTRNAELRRAGKLTDEEYQDEVGEDDGSDVEEYEDDENLEDE